jgi:hypothetical protein
MCSPCKSKDSVNDKLFLEAEAAYESTDEFNNVLLQADANIIIQDKLIASLSVDEQVLQNIVDIRNVLHRSLCDLRLQVTQTRRRIHQISDYLSQQALYSLANKTK